ncbi:MAG TPA: aminotransferase class V-fold PLP-dependent enzyme [Thermoanaerobaculia bacterium]|nr:aminotransferase class V-fold PLP-dependent enzyme [Thermoanaerobaculia bacterium]
MSEIRFKVAREPRELEQLHALHYAAFVEEIPQHAPNADARLIDRFHNENTYVIALDGDTVVGSLALRATRPFSLDQKLPQLDAYLPDGHRFFEVRLLNVRKEHRRGTILPGLLAGVWEWTAGTGHDCALISATTRQLKLYSHMGFIPFGPLVGAAGAAFQPMYITKSRFIEQARETNALVPALRGDVVNLLTGPVAIHPDVAAAFSAPPQPHRSPAFDDDLRTLRHRLRALVHAPHVQVLLGSGTLANDTVGAQLSLLGGHGVVISNGEFGERLADHAMRAQLDFEHLRFDWGEPLDLGALESRDYDWLWMAACETSAGVLNDIGAAGRICRVKGAKLCLDAVSAIGAVPLDFSGVWLATGTSGKALASYPGLSLVFHCEPIAISPRLPRYLDLGLYARDGTPFTHSSNLVRALRVAVERAEWTSHFEQTRNSGAWLRAQLHRRGFAIIGERGTPAPHVVTIALPPHVSSADCARRMEHAGFLIGHASAYLLERNWIQICLMGGISRAALRQALSILSMISDSSTPESPASVHEASYS